MADALSSRENFRSKFASWGFAKTLTSHVCATVRNPAAAGKEAPMSYENIVKYYDCIFPLQAATLKFLRNTFSPSHPVLDVGCGSGEYTIGLASSGYSVHGCDLDPAMVSRAEAKAREQNAGATFSVGSMTDLSRLFPAASFGGLFCIGNTLAHAAGHDQLAAICGQCHALLQPAGRIVLQIINYDRIVSQNLTGLPTIENHERGLSFERRYAIAFPMVTFTTTLRVDGITETSVNQLYAVTCDELVQCLQGAGFSQIETYGSFAPAPFDLNASQPLIIRARK